MRTLLAVWLTWDALLGAEPPVEGYRLYYGPNPGLQTIFLDVGNVTTAELKDLPPRVPIFIVCRAYAGALESLPSNEVTWIEPKPRGKSGKPRR